MLFLNIHVPGSAALGALGVLGALGALGVHAPVIRCSLLCTQGQWSEILGALLLLERADSLLMLIGTQQGATPMMCVRACVCAQQNIIRKIFNMRLHGYMRAHTHYDCAPSHAMSHLTASLSGSVKHSREPVTSSPQSSHSLLCDGVSVCVCVYVFSSPKKGGGFKCVRDSVYACVC